MLIFDQVKSLFRYHIPLTTVSLIILSACGNQKSLTASSPSRSKTPNKPQFEHEALEGRRSPWVATENSDGESRVKLREFIDDWEGTPHVWGGNTRKGVDCSGLVIQCYLQVYEKEFIGRRAEDLFGETTPIKRDELREGDLVFFKIKGRRIDHVGIYLSEGDFLHTSSSRGVMVSNLKEAYFKQRFFMGGRPK